MKILVINCGSSSLKYQLIDMEEEMVLAQGVVERIGMDDAFLTHKVPGFDKRVISESMNSHKEAIALVLKALTDPEYGLIQSYDEIDAVGHRVVHGGTFHASARITDSVIRTLEECTKLAPLHNPPNIVGIQACMEIMPNTPMVAVFDTAFHQTMPEHAFVYPIPYELYEEHGIRKYGFHGTSHKYVSLEAAKILGKESCELNAVSCHLGNGSSVCAIKNGKSVDTTMGFTPLAGVAMGTRTGNIDPAIPTYMMQELNLSAAETLDILNKKSGILGISGVSSDFRDIRAAAPTNHRAQLALDIFAYEIKRYISAYVGIIGGADCVIFTAGIGENVPSIRAACCEGLECLGLVLDPEKNEQAVGVPAVISTDQSRIKVLVIPTNEELMIARDTKALV